MGHLAQPPRVQAVPATLDGADEVAAHLGPLGELLLAEIAPESLVPDPAADLAPVCLLAVPFLVGSRTHDDRGSQW